MPSALVATLCGDHRRLWTRVRRRLQQELRQAANDPQIQLAEDAASSLADGTPAASLVATTKVDMASSLAPFLIIYDNHDTVISSSATLDDRTPRLPTEVLSSARSAGEDRVTWEPSSEVRIAAVVVAYPGGAVLAGGSLRDVEVRELNALGLAAAGRCAAEVAVTVAILGVDWWLERRRV